VAAAVKLKDGVSLVGVQWQMFKAAIIAEAVYREYGTELVITSANDGKHKDGSLHYQGKALDLRTWTLNGREVMVHAKLQRELAPDYDVILERDHIHVEYQPKTNVSI